jgi:hypothetical protein
VISLGQRGGRVCRFSLLEERESETKIEHPARLTLFNFVITIAHPGLPIRSCMPDYRAGSFAPCPLI